MNPLIASLTKISQQLFQKNNNSKVIIVEPPVEELSLLDRIQEIITMSKSSPLVTTLIVTLLSILLCLGVANTSRAEAFRVGFHRRVIKPVITPIQKMVGKTTNKKRERPGRDFRSPSRRERSRSASSEASSRSTLSSFDFFQDLQHPFGNHSTEDWTAHVTSPEIVHFCFLLHGHRGLSKDLSYMQVMMQKVAAEQKQSRSTHDMVVHTSVCNEGKTTDGIRNGGERLVQEIRDTIEEEMIKRHPELHFLKDGSEPPKDDDPSTIYDVTISILGNSLGGLFGRYAIAKLMANCCELESKTGCYILDGRFRLHLNIFCTTATPHLGISRHTYVKLPRPAEIGVAHALGDTGRDLFRLNDLLHSMATAPMYLKPLAKFRKRIAYANAYGTDFAVPASTAAFLSENSTYAHHIIETNTTSQSTSSSEDGKTTVTNESHGGLVIATLHTPMQPHNESDSESDDLASSEHSHKSGDNEDELDQMSRCLDQLGWKKVFVDIRRELPNAELPFLGRSSADVATPSAIPNLQSLQMESRVVESREVASAVASPADNRVALPMGHNMIVAFSRSRLSTFMNKGGRP
eukprot:CAMPEP_0176002298 /NCGR_PEP_ID=MMETSP0120_2-20121206/574_1 /TAXON_ID=160619 /ORGANISM="Kryptoperidinium foliaceum, Strain CCMP 1326" /LENGTH=577 /DNA_ID=CAMNT_0017334881 /DNA_START=265 /DNA_END=1995 /DNA_ORIENTATION=+